MKLLYSKNFSDQTLTYFIARGMYGGFVIAYNGTNVALGNTTLADLGQVELNIKGDNIINAPAQVLNLVNNEYGGVSTFSNVAGGAVSGFVYIPAGAFWDYSNVYLLNDSDRAYFQLNFSALASLWSAGTVKIYGIPKQGVQNYIYHFQSRNVVSGGAGEIADSHPVENVLNVALYNLTSLTNLQIQKDNVELVNASTNDALMYSDWLHQIETTQNLILLELTPSKNVSESLGGIIQFNYRFSGASTLQQYFGFVSFTNQKAVESKAQVVADLRKKVQAIKTPMQAIPTSLIATE